MKKKTFFKKLELIYMNKKVALVTGSAKRIGKEIVLHLANNNYQPLIHYNKSGKEARNLKKSLSDRGIVSKIIKYDLNNINNIKKFSRECIKKFGKIDLLINNASIFIEDKNSDDRILKNLNINLISTILLSKHIGDHMIKRCSGNIINIGDAICLTNHWTKFSSYTISKMGLDSLTKTFSKNLKNNVRINSINLGAILKPSNKKIRSLYKKNYKTETGITSILNTIDYIIKNKKINGQIFNIDNGEKLMVNAN